LEQITAVVNAFQVSGTDLDKERSEFANVLETSADRAAVARSSVMNSAAKQTKAGIEAVKAQPGIAGTEAETMADRIQSSFDTVIDAQKQLVGMAAKQMKAAAAKAYACPECFILREATLPTAEYRSVEPGRCEHSAFS